MVLAPGTRGLGAPGCFRLERCADVNAPAKNVPGLGEAPPAEVLRENLRSVRERIAAVAADPSRVKLVAVTKGFGLSAVRRLLEIGVADLGENYAEELYGKARSLGGGGRTAESPRWHYIGTIQRRSVVEIAPLVSVWHTVARGVEGREIVKRVGDAPLPRVMVQVEATGLPGRNGCARDEVPDLVAELREMGLVVEGLTALGPPGTAEDARSVFRQVAKIADRLGLGELSMGMSDDLEVAVEEGSTMVRVGRALLGDRPPRHSRSHGL